MFRQGEYVRSTITKDEVIKVKAEYHWVAWLWFYFIFFTLGGASAVCFVITFGAYIQDEFEPSMFYSILGLVFAIYPFIVYLELHLAEMVSTNKRVVYRTGIISMKTEEIKTDRIESIQVEQSIIGRIFGYGNILFSGTGTAKVEFKKIKNPLKIKAGIEEVVDEVNKELGRESRKKNAAN
jgi:uncharacterized membrane protein YdbT with pleckstrin-like domain